MTSEEVGPEGAGAETCQIAKREGDQVQRDQVSTDVGAVLE